MLKDRVVTRRYRADDNGSPILIGLSRAETVEFETLEQTSPADKDGNPFWVFEGPPKSETERRWLELYLKHEAAWDDWHRQPHALHVRPSRTRGPNYAIGF